ncbi:homeobox protein SEBOX [Bufo gargarizans]|uniref:homeobox protein SEBOX n=1 Tax=Bufo gargarizans TaxID=30331 RepID=UPI001CF3913B|nr:homeobox protein SEBOX [Bufo gargarizans]
MEKILRAAFCPNTGLPVWGCQDTVPAPGTESKPKETGSPVNGTPNQRKRKRTLYSKWQQVELESVFQVIPYPDISTREHLAKVIRLPESKVQVWFQNRRARKNKSGKSNKYLYRRGSSLQAHHLYSSSASSSQGCSQRDALMPMPLPHGHPGQHVSSLQQTRYPSFPQMSRPVSEQFSYPQTYRQQDVQWQNVTSSPDYGYNAPLYETQRVEAFTIPSQGSYWEMFPHTVNENGSQTSLGYLSDVIYNAAIITNLGDL